MNEYEISGIENISRGICIIDGKVLLCRGKGLNSTYLPGGHIEFGETGREALVREMKEETGLDAKANGLVAVVENSFMQHDRRHCEINLVYTMEIADAAALQSQESWIGFEWCPLGELERANLLPVAMRELVRNIPAPMKEVTALDR